MSPFARERGQTKTQTLPWKTSRPHTEWTESARQTPSNVNAIALSPGSIEKLRGGIERITECKKGHKKCKGTRRGRKDYGTAVQGVGLRLACLDRDECFEVRWEEAGVETRRQEEVVAVVEALDTAQTGEPCRRHAGAGLVGRGTHRNWLR